MNSWGHVQLRRRRRMQANSRPAPPARSGSFWPWQCQTLACKRAARSPETPRAVAFWTGLPVAGTALSLPEPRRWAPGPRRTQPNSRPSGSTERLHEAAAKARREGGGDASELSWQQSGACHLVCARDQRNGWSCPPTPAHCPLQAMAEGVSGGGAQAGGWKAGLRAVPGVRGAAQAELRGSGRL